LRELLPPFASIVVFFQSIRLEHIRDRASPTGFFSVTRQRQANPVLERLASTCISENIKMRHPESKENYIFEVYSLPCDKK
jgi:hypothetical protein